MSAETTEIVSEAVTYLDALQAIESLSYPTMAKAIDARDEARELSRKAAEALGSKPDYDDYDDISEWVADLMTWDDLVDRLHPTDKKRQKCQFCGRSMNPESLASHQSRIHPHEWEVRRSMTLTSPLKTWRKRGERGTRALRKWTDGAPRRSDKPPKDRSTLGEYV